MPQKAAGNLTLPPISVPTPKGTHLDTMSPASPPLDPPQDRFCFRGFLACPNIKLQVSKARAVCGQLPLTIGIAPAFNRSLTGIPSSSTLSAHLKAHPTVANLSF